jgi:hypothetical protein
MIATGLKMGMGYLRRDYNDPTDDGVVSFAHTPHDDTVCLHQVRNPLKTIASSLTESMNTYYLIFKVLRMRPTGPRYKAFYRNCNEIQRNFLLPMWTWIFLNRHIAKMAQWRYRIEDIDSVYPEICQRCGVQPKEKVPDVERNYNTRPHKQLSWDDLWETDKDMTKVIACMANEYGYNTD